MQASTFAGANPRRDALVLLLVMGAALLAPAFLNRGLVFIAGIVWINAVFGLAFNLLFKLIYQMALNYPDRR